MQALVWRLRSARRYLSWPALIALGLLLASSVVYVERVLPDVAELAALSAAIDPVPRAPKNALADEKPLSPEAQLAAFYAFFPGNDAPSEAPSDTLDRIFAAAAKENLALPQGEYQWSKERQGALIHYGITLPLKGPYPGLRRFMAQVLRENPALSLDTVSFGRQTVSDIGVDAQVQFTLYLRSEVP